MHDLGAAAGAHGGVPVVHRLVAALCPQCVEAVAEGGGVGDEVVVVGDQQGDARFDRQFEPDAGRGAHPLDQPLRHAQVADLLALALDEDGSRRVEPVQGVPDPRVELLLRRLRGAWHEAEHRAAVIGERLEVKHLLAARCQGAEQAALAGAGRAADDAQVEAGGQRVERRDDGASIFAVAAFEQMDAKADLVEHGSERTAALAAAPAVDQR